MVKNSTGQIFWPQYGINLIGNLQIGQGYQLKMNSAQTLSLAGTQNNPGETTLSIPAGWSYIGYLHISPALIANMLVPLGSDLVLAKNGTGQIYWPAYSVNLIGQMNPGQGYQLKMNNAVIFSYPGLLPTLNTLPITNISTNSASSGGTIGLAGGQTVTARGVCWNTTGNPTIADSITIDGSGTGSFTSNLTNLNTSTTYYVRAYATNIIGTDYGNELSFTTTQPTFTCGTSTISDFDGNTYNTVQIGNQCWMKQNLATTHYANGAALVDGTSAGNISGNYTTKYWFVYNNQLSNKATYGLLYTWAGATNGVSGSANPSGVQGACPNGWHLPSDNEWKQMEMFLGMTLAQADATGWRGTDQGGKLKEAGTSHWYSPNTGATNSSGFQALPGGYRDYIGSFTNLGHFGYWWPATESSSSYAWYRFLGSNSANVGRYLYTKDLGLSVRCVRDN
jgi:uncharacterized protein (TIGR02145 family)